MIDAATHEPFIIYQTSVRISSV